ncbi:hypothetical protein F5884DRAFT_315355 [Xylogone sp. PMI_703]|nr:hypothetical protein F5884DRAFT_315355 [Xylogone sp. PMI_703]
MVGALRNNSCKTCRGRKVKCDQAWPICGPCMRSGRLCPPRPSLQVIDETELLRERLTKARSRKKLIRSQNQHRFQGEDEKRCISRTSSPDAMSTRATLSLTPSERLSYSLIDSIHTEDPSSCLGILGIFISQIPRRLGTNVALDHVTECLLRAHTSLLRGDGPSKWINRRLYVRALRSVQHAIKDPAEEQWSNTLCATLVLQRIEAAFNQSVVPEPGMSMKDWLGHGELVHGAGVAALMQKMGPPKNKEDAMIAIDGQACVIHRSVILGVDCFLSSAKWNAAFENVEGRTDLQILLHRIMRQMSVWPSLLRRKTVLRKGTSIDPVADLSTLWNASHKVKNVMHVIGEDLDALIEDRDMARVVPSISLLALVDKVYEFDENMPALLLCYQAMYSIVVLRIIWSVTVDPDYLEELESELLYYSKRIWMLVDHGRRFRPLGIPILYTALVLTLESADEEVHECITQLVNELNGSFNDLEVGSWTTEKLIYKAMLYRGDFIIPPSPRGEIKVSI